MILSLTSFLSSSTAITLLTIILYVILRKNSILSSFGLGCMYFMVYLILVRGFLPFDFYKIKLTTSIYSTNILPKLNDAMKFSLLSVGKTDITPYKILFCIWIIGILISAGKLLNAYHKSKNYLYSLPIIKDETINLVFQDILRSVFPKKTPTFRLVYCDSFRSPAIFVTKELFIILPSMNYTSDHLHSIFQHELLHYKQKDFLCKIILDILICIHWWNPLISKFLFPMVKQIQELSIDYHLTKTQNKIQKEAYLDTLLNTLQQDVVVSAQKTAHNNIYSLVDNHSKKNIQQRFYYLTQPRVRSFSIYGIVLCIFMFICSFTIVFEPYYKHRFDENGNPVYQNIEGETFYIKNGDVYDLYMQNQYVYTTPKIFEEFKNAPIYNSLEEVLTNETN